MSCAYGQKRERKTKLNTLPSKCATQARICQRAAHSDNKCVQRHTIHSNRLHRLAVAELGDRECCLNNSWGEKACEPPAAGHSPPFRSHSEGALPSPAQGGILDGFPWEIPDKSNRRSSDWPLRDIHSISRLLHELCHCVYGRIGKS